MDLGGPGELAGPTVEDGRPRDRIERGNRLPLPQRVSRELGLVEHLVDHGEPGVDGRALGFWRTEIAKVREGGAADRRDARQGARCTGGITGG